MNLSSLVLLLWVWLSVFLLGDATSVQMDPLDCDMIPCSKEYDPVCGSDGKTYVNGCTFVVAQCKDCTLSLVALGECQYTGDTNHRRQLHFDPCDRPCTRECRPVCGSDGVTYANKCLFNNAKCHHPGLILLGAGCCDETPPNPDVDPCDKPCTREYIPVCGSDGRTYANKCLFENAKCKNPCLRIIYYDECPPDDHDDHSHH